MLRRLVLSLVFVALLVPGAVVSAADAEPAVSTTMQLTVLNQTDMLMAYEGKPILKDKAATFTLERFTRDDELSQIFLELRENPQDEEPSGDIVLFLVRAPEALWAEIESNGDLKAVFYEHDGGNYAELSATGNDSAKALFLYHPVLKEWALLETQYGVMVYQDNGLDWEAWQRSQEAGGQEFRTSWEHLYPGEMNDWLRSYMESRGFIVPITEIYNVGTWGHNDIGSFKLERLTPDIAKVTQNQLIVVKTFGDFGWGMLSYQTPDKKWHFIEYGYDGWGGFGGMWYKIIDDIPSDYITYDSEDVPWAQKP